MTPIDSSQSNLERLSIDSGSKKRNTLEVKILRKKRTTSGPVKLSEIKNFGPVTLAEFHSMGFTTLEQLEELGLEEICRKYVMYFPDRLNANAILGIICALENTVWTQATAAQKKSARKMAEELRAELGVRRPST